MEITFPPGGPVELKREDGWFYRLHGVVGFDLRHDGWDWYRESVLEVTIRDISDQTLDSIRVLRDEFPNMQVQINHDTY